MNSISQRDHQAILKAKERELIAALRNREGLAMETEAEFGDQIQQAADRVIVIETLDRSSVLLRQVRAALDRIADGSYGQCLVCEEPISPKRLAAIPWAGLCFDCQDREDQQRSSSPVFLEIAAPSLKQPGEHSRAAAPPPRSS